MKGQGRKGRRKGGRERLPEDGSDAARDQTKKLEAPELVDATAVRID
jgi:hypothetical protein